MSTEKCFRDDLSNCLIDFKKKVSITALLNDYGGTLEQISSDLKDFIADEENNKSKLFDKNYLVRGFTDDKGNQLITIVNQGKLEKIQSLLKKPISLLFSVEEVGDGRTSESPIVDDHTFQPIQNKWIVLNNVRKAATEEKKPLVIKKEPQEVASKPKDKKKDFFGATSSKEKAKPQESIAEDKKKDFFGATTSKDKAKPKESPVEDKKKGATSTKDNESPKSKKEDPPKGGIKNMFQKQAAKPKPPAKTPVKKITEEPLVQHSPNIFEESSDEDETLAAMKKELHESDEEMQEPSTSTKRRRIVDSDDEEEMPEKKQEKLESSVVEDGVYYVYEEVLKTFTDDEGFNVTKKERVRKAVTAPPEKIAEKSKEEKSAGKKTPVQGEKKKTSPKAAEKKKPAAGSDKRKQGSITSFFTKK